MRAVIPFQASLCLGLLIVSSQAWAKQSDNPLAVMNGGVQRSEDAPYVPANFEFYPGDYVFFTFHVSGFKIKPNETGETKSLSLAYEVTPQDERHVPLTEPVSGDIKGDVTSEDKNWIPKRRASFLLPSYLAAGHYFVHVTAKDLLANTEASRDYPFEIGGVHVAPTAAIQVADFEFLRHEDDPAALDIPAFAPGDIVWARFQMIGFKMEPGNKYRLTYGLKVLRPDGRPFLDTPQAAQISSDSFYPAQFVPGALQIITPKDAQHGSYELTLTVRDMVANQSFDLKRTFTIE